MRGYRAHPVGHNHQDRQRVLGEPLEGRAQVCPAGAGDRQPGGQRLARCVNLVVDDAGIVLEQPQPVFVAAAQDAAEFGAELRPVLDGAAVG